MVPIVAYSLLYPVFLDGLFVFYFSLFFDSPMPGKNGFTIAPPPPACHNHGVLFWMIPWRMGILFCKTNTLNI